MLILDQRSPEPIVEGDYQYALVHLAWYRKDQARFLLFGMVELFPAEFPPPDPTPELSLRTRVLGRQDYLYLCRYGMSAADALGWYADCRAGTVALPEPGWEPGKSQRKCLATTALHTEPAWPHLVSGTRLPFHAWGMARSHHLLQSGLPPEARAALDLPEAARWLSDRLYFDVEDHREWLGSVSLIAPNPVVRSFHYTLGVLPDGSEVSDIHLIPRSGHSLDDLTLYVTEHRPGGIAGVSTVPISGTHLRIAHVGRAEEVSHALVCLRRGVLDWLRPAGFLRSMHIKAQIVTGQKKVIVPSMPGREGEEYTQPIHAKGFDTVVGETSAPPITSHLRSAHYARQRRQEAERLGQKLFHGDETEARDFVRLLISRAYHRVVIIDPYFATAELFRFALATSRSTVDVKIITSGELLKKPERSDPTAEGGEVLLRQLSALTEHGHFTVMVMAGDPPPVHDRFLIIDDEVWLSGNSLHSIGERAGILIRLPAPEPVVAMIKTVLDDPQTKPLPDWVAQRRQAKALTALPPFPDSHERRGAND